MTNFIQQIVSGLACGGIYGSLALAIVLIHRSTGVINFAQGEMATLSAFICWTLIEPRLGVLARVRRDARALVRRRRRARGRR